MADEILLNLTEAEAVVLDLDESEEVTLNFTEEIISLEVVGQVGPRGPAGASSGFFRFHQATPVLQWSFVHDLPYPPAITVVDTAGSALYGDLLYIDDQTIQIDFSVPTAGYAYLS